MSALAIDLGGTKLAMAVFSDEGLVLSKEIIALDHRSGSEVGSLITGQIGKSLETDFKGDRVTSVGVSVPGIFNAETGRVWAPNIPGWDEYPLAEEIRNVSGDIPLAIDSDRACCILGEVWKGNAAGCRNAIFLAVGTGIGAGILADGRIVRGKSDIAGAVGWMVLERPFKKKYGNCGCFEYYASGEGIARLAGEYLEREKDYRGELLRKRSGKISSHDVFAAYRNDDEIAVKVMNKCIGYWGMAVANLVSLFNPEKIIFGGGIFGPGESLLPAIRSEAARWAQPVSFGQVSIESSGLPGDAALYGAACLALKVLQDSLEV